MNIDITHPLNQRVLQFLSQGGKSKDPVIAPANSVSVKDAYMNLGSHPDVVEQVWDKLGGALPEICRGLVYGTPALVHPNVGVVFAFCKGTSYFLRLDAASHQEALKNGYSTHIQWSDGSETNIMEEMGPHWVFGRWKADEINWCQAVYNELTTTLS